MNNLDLFFQNDSLGLGINNLFGLNEYNFTFAHK
ncbi:hypothetical protein BH10BAC2_BH10BAC2_06740 [soil metagenome]